VDGGSGGRRPRPSKLGISLYCVASDHPTFFRVDEPGETTGDSAEDCGVMFDNGFGLGEPPKKRRSISPGFFSLRLDSRGGVGGLAARVGDIDLEDDGSPMATRAVCGTTRP
jgi:hypothetical protein